MIRYVLTAMAALAFALPVGIAQGADKYTIDPAHADVSFKIGHLGLSRIMGRFNEISGTFTIDPSNPAGSNFNVTIPVKSIDTNQKQRDQHLLTPDFFDEASFPTMTFVSSEVRPVDGGLEVSGNITLHGVTRPLKVVLKGGGSAEFPPGVQRTGYTTDFVIKRSDFGMTNFAGVVGDEVAISISFEGIKEK
jgi:polyisoprenoid-binding protein YceI